MDFTHIPAVLKAEAQWVCWRTEDRDGEATKVPIDAQTGVYASVAEPATWADFATAREYAREVDGIAGIGFVFTAADPYAGVDLDACRDLATGEVEDWAIDVLRRLDSYTERSPSGTGFHVLVQGAVPAGGHRAGQLELYDRNRYFTVTGDRVPGAPTVVAVRDVELRAVHAEYIASSGKADDTATRGDAVTARATDVDLSDEALLERAMNAANGEKFRRLWAGDTSGYPSHSEADLALCSLLAFWTGGDAERIERLFDRSGLVREKWRERPDYRRRTIRTAIRGCGAFYNPGTEE
ncbi:hypothetical protein [Natrinema sp. 1APR25-10V2]|uniref:phage NrS-1 polymerase family protein n=1 Tax=Natrinema sp. 1APR25-10V2 TaxID=2951081 RepID=UPI0028748A60|nr:hypothetical protein [Natrinema sp. 1APR25-10V2]MDS0476801.1 hypothetical protein [Natrinema sp. 1APR25-10V2]